MRRTLFAEADSYVTDKWVDRARATGSNVGAAGSLDLFKLSGEFYSGSTPLTERSRLLVRFDLDPLRELVAQRRVDPGHSSFACTLRLFDVYGGQPTPAGFSVVVHPLSRSFDEGLGRDAVFFADQDACNWISSSLGVEWHVTGCGLGGGASGSVDYIDSLVLAGVTASLEASQDFDTGFEDLSVDVTRVVSATLVGLLPDQGFRITLAPTHEADDRTYFVKRFASRHAYDPTRHPRLDVRYDESLQDDTAALAFDTDCTMVLRNRARGRLAPILSGAAMTPVTGHGCLVLKMETEVSGAGWSSTWFTGSQHLNGVFWVTGVYTASVRLSSADPVLAAKLAASGSVVFRPVWSSVDGTLPYVTGSTVTVRPPERSSSGPSARRLRVSVTGLRAEVFRDERLVLRVSVFDPDATNALVVRAPAQDPGIVMRDVHVAVRNAATNELVLPFDVPGSSSRCSSDAAGHFFELDGACLPAGRTYVVDVMLAGDENPRVYRDASTKFRVLAAQ
jgi:hypothetical protein